MSRNTIIWIVVAVVVVLLLLALLWTAMKKGAQKKHEKRRDEAENIRGDAAAQERTVRGHEAEAAEQEALARQARAESDRKAAAAEKLELQADERSEHAAGKRTEQRERFRAADEIDPDVQHEGDRESGGHDRGNHRDTHGARGDVAESGDRAGSRLDSES